MEREFIGSSVYHSVSRANLQLVADNACRYYGVAPIKIEVYDKPDDRIFGRFMYYAHADGTIEPRKIRLNRGFHGANLCTLFHELAHYVTDMRFGEGEGHGPRFAGIYMHLLDKYRVLPAVAFRALAEKWHVEIAGRFKPGAIK